MQIFYSVGVAMGAIITFGSYQKQGNMNYVRDGSMSKLQREKNAILQSNCMLTIP